MAGPRILQKMGESCAVRAGLTVVATLLLGATLVFNGLAGTGTGPFSHAIGNVSSWYDTCITPAGYTFSIWNIIYIFLLFTVIYGLNQLCRKERGSEAPVWKLGGAMPLSFLFAFILNLCTNIGWLFAWDRQELLTSTIMLMLLAITNLFASGFSAHGFSEAAPTLKRLSRADYWCSVMVINGYAMYTTWSCLAACINLAIFLIHGVSTDAATVCVTMLSLVAGGMIVFAILEATVFARSLNVLVSHYFVYLWASIGIYSKNSASASSAEFGLLVTNIVVAAALCVVRVVLVALRNHHKEHFDISSPRRNS